MYSTGTKTSTYSYDPLHRLQSEAQQLPGLTGDYTLTYAWTPGGQLQSLADSLTGSSASYTSTTVNYAFDKAGQLSQLSGQSGSNTLQFFNSLKYRAWGATKEIVHGNSVRSLMTWDRKLLRLTKFDLDNMQTATWVAPNQYTYSPLTMTWEYDYHADGRVNHAWDRNWSTFDRAYTWDHLGRVEEAYTANEANGQNWQPWETHTNPYRQSLRYDAFGNMNDRFGFFWSRYQSSMSFYTNDRRDGWVYDASGKITQDSAGTHTLSVTGNQTAFVSSAQISFVNGVDTGLDDLPMSEIAQTYDGGGQAVKRVETQRDPDYNQNNQTWYYNENVTTTHYVRSSVLGGVVIAELDQTGAKEKAFVYAGGSKIAEHHVVGGSFVEWRHPNPGTTSWVTTSDLRTGKRSEMDPLGAATGTTDPYPVYLDYTDIKNGEPLYLDGGNPFDYSGGCELDGMPVNCNSVSTEATVAFKWGTPNTIYLNGQFLFLQAFANGDYGYLPQGAFSVNGKWYDSEENEISVQSGGDIKKRWNLIYDISRQNRAIKPTTEAVRDETVWGALFALEDENCAKLIGSEKNGNTDPWGILRAMFGRENINAVGELPSGEDGIEPFANASFNSPAGQINVGRRFFDVSNSLGSVKTYAGAFHEVLTIDEARITIILHELSHITGKYNDSSRHNTNEELHEETFVRWDDQKKRYVTWDREIYETCIKSLRTRLGVKAIRF
jgi:hypothetical protein